MAASGALREFKYRTRHSAADQLSADIGWQYILISGFSAHTHHTTHRSSVRGRSLTSNIMPIGQRGRLVSLGTVAQCRAS